MKRLLALAIAFLLFASFAGAQSWTPLTNQTGVAMNTALLLTDGTVMVQQDGSNDAGSGSWWKLTPDNHGSYINGTWKQLASMPSGYTPHFYASVVLPDGRVLVEGGEYNGSTTPSYVPLGAIYDPAADAWTSLPAPSGVTQIGDASGLVLPNGMFMLGPIRTSSQWILNPSTLSWSVTGSGKSDANSEETWTLLPNGKVLTVDTADGINSEIYDPAAGSWSSAGNTIVTLPTNNGDNRFVAEIGPAVLRPDGTVFATGATSFTAIFNTATNSWSVGPTFPNNLRVADGPAALLPSGNVLVDASPFSACCYQFFEFDGTNLISVPLPQFPTLYDAPTASFTGRMLVLPTGQILFTNGLITHAVGGVSITGPASVEVYTGAGSPRPEWAPVVTSAPSTLVLGSYNNLISGTQFNGLSQGAVYGDDAQSATNYPLVRITNNATGHVSYIKTHDHSTMAVATGSTPVSTEADLSTLVETGASTLQVVANGIASNGVAVQITSTGNPFMYRTARDQKLACYGISVAPNFPSNCTDISDPDDKQMCFGMSENSQTPCRAIQDRNLQLACYGMSVAPNFPSNCNSISDPQLQSFCYGVSSGSTANCNNLADNNTRAMCQGISVHDASFCSSITNTNDQLFCQGIASRSQTPCTSIRTFAP